MFECLVRIYTTGLFDISHSQPMHLHYENFFHGAQNHCVLTFKIQHAYAIGTYGFPVASLTLSHFLLSDLSLWVEYRWIWRTSKGNRKKKNEPSIRYIFSLTDTHDVCVAYVRPTICYIIWLIWNMVRVLSFVRHQLTIWLPALAGRQYMLILRAS